HHPSCTLFPYTTLFRSEKMFKKNRGLDDDGYHYFQEILVFSDNLLHIFQRCKNHPDHAVVWVCNKAANVGMALTKARMSLAGVRSEEHTSELQSRENLV